MQLKFAMPRPSCSRRWSQSQSARSPSGCTPPKAGDTFYEGPDDVHTVSANASDTEPAKFLVFMIKDKAAPIASPSGQRPQP